MKIAIVINLKPVLSPEHLRLCLNTYGRNHAASELQALIMNRMEAIGNPHEEVRVSLVHWSVTTAHNGVTKVESAFDLLPDNLAVSNAARVAARKLATGIGSSAGMLQVQAGVSMRVRQKADSFAVQVLHGWYQVNEGGIIELGGDPA